MKAFRRGNLATCWLPFVPHVYSHRTCRVINLPPVEARCRNMAITYVAGILDQTLKRRSRSAYSFPQPRVETIYRGQTREPRSHSVLNSPCILLFVGKTELQEPHLNVCAVTVKLAMVMIEQEHCHYYSHNNHTCTDFGGYTI